MIGDSNCKMPPTPGVIMNTSSRRRYQAKLPVLTILVVMLAAIIFAPTSSQTQIRTTTNEVRTCTPQSKLKDPGFEASTGTSPITNPFWYSSRPLCSVAACGSTSSAAPRNGANWLLFRGFAAAGTIEFVDQAFTAPAGATATLNYYLWIGAVNAPFADVLEVRVDGTIMQSFTEPSVAEGGYTLHSLNLNALAGGSHSITFEYRSPEGGIANFNVDDVTVDVCGASFNSRKTGVFRPATGELFLKNANSSGFADTYIIYGNPGDYPLTGDWNGDGLDSVGVYRNGVFYLRNSNSTGFADIVIPFGNPGDQPIAGDWNGDGIDTIGVYRNGTFYLRNSNTAGDPDLVFKIGFLNTGDVALAGDWNGDGITTCGVFRPSNGIVYLRNSNSPGAADIGFTFGNAGDKPVVGDWDGDGIDTIGIYRDGLFYLSNDNFTTFADTAFVLGNSGDFPIAGNWNGQP
jgi:hypothetical protein